LVMRRLLILLWLLGLALAAPRLVVEPEDGVKPLLDLIASAKKEVLVKMYLWTPSRMDLVEALGEAVKRGVRVRVLLEREPSGGRVDLAVFQALKERGVEVRLTTPFRFVFVHEKSLVVDRKRAWVGTMNLTGSSFAANREHHPGRPRRWPRSPGSLRRTGRGRGWTSPEPSWPGPRAAPSPG